MNLCAIITDYEAQNAAIRVVRDEVFVNEQAVDREEEYDDRDPICMHVVVFDGPLAVATGRIDLEKGGKVGRIAVRDSYRRKGIGTLVMRKLEQVAVQAGVNRMWFHAQTQAVPFYTCLGYVVCSEEEFLEANIPHVVMEKSLAPSQ